MTTIKESAKILSAFDSATFGQNGSFQVDKPIGSATISPCGRDVALASRQGLHIIDLDSPWSPPRHLAYHTPWEVVDVQWSPFAVRDYWVVSTSNQKALVWNLNLQGRQGSVEHILDAHTRAISDINFSAHYPDILATCAVDSFVHCWDLRNPASPAMTFCDWFAGATQVKWNRTNPHILASSHDKFLRVWDDRKGTCPLRTIEAHATKIYGIDWNRFNTTDLVTCSLDRTIKLWDYTEDTNEPKHTFHTAFPVWRARHTPFGYGLLAMPQRGDNDLHLYDRRSNENTEENVVTRSVHTFEGHNDQVKEFLWRPRGNVSATMDDRDYQLVSWGADRVLRLHQVTDDVLKSVGYQKGMEVRRTTGFTRKGAPYKTFRDTQHMPDTGLFPMTREILGGRTGPTMRLPSSLRVNQSLAHVTSRRKDGGKGDLPMRMKGKHSQDTDPISWMRGVKIGKRSASQPRLHKNISTVLSPTLNAQPVWDVYESLGEEITAAGDKFSRIQFEEVDMQRNRLIISLPGPWGPDKTSTYIRARIGFPSGYPNTAAASVSIEKTTSVHGVMLQRMISDVDSLASEFLTIRRSSLETILRYLLGEQSLGEILQSLQKHMESDDILSTQDEGLDSSDDDDEIPGAFTQIQSDSIESIGPFATVNNAQYNVPLPKACGAVWSEDGTLVCFFPSKQDKEASILDHSLRITPRNRSAFLEGFGRLHEASRRRLDPASSLNTIEGEDTQDDDYDMSSSDSSLSSSDNDLPQHHFLPAMVWSGSGLDLFQKMALDGSQKSANETGTAKSTSHKAAMIVSLHRLSDLLPSKKSLARRYVSGDTHMTAAQNAAIARECGYSDLADVWCLIEMILQNIIPVHILQHPSGNGSIIAIARRASSFLHDKNVGIDFSDDADDENESSSPFNHVSWGSHPLGQRWLIKQLFRHFEQIADVQMLAMMACVFSKLPVAMENEKHHPVRPASFSYYASVAVATSLFETSHDFSPSKLLSTSLSTVSSAETSVGEQLAVSCESNTPPSYRTSRMKNERRNSQTISLSSSPEQHRHLFRSNSNLSAFAASFARPFAFNNSAASSPPNGIPKNKVSPSGSYIGTAPSSMTWTSTGMFSRALSKMEDSKSKISLSMSDTEEDYRPVAVDTSSRICGFTTTLVNQGSFHDEGFAELPLLDATRQSQYFAFREAYGELLSAWGLPFARCELLKFNTGLSPPSDQLHVGQSFPADSGKGVESASVILNTRCISCSCLLLNKSKGGQCPDCLQVSDPHLCMLCSSYIEGVASPCLNCGHMLHAACREAVLGMDYHECVSGCGCVCSRHPWVEMPQPEVRTQRSRYQRDVSPAITVIADSVVNEQEIAGWKGSEWEEMAYESLARNLRGARRVSGQVLADKANSIWRGSST